MEQCGHGCAAFIEASKAPEDWRTAMSSVKRIEMLSLFGTLCSIMRTITTVSGWTSNPSLMACGFARMQKFQDFLHKIGKEFNVQDC